ncbi:hypothetical protein NUW58_g3883 [Xylaria curta]|uniref:Uncharacterized protein n=1 Tax=Xylaria curta TaxID=42375 RepID=A0ACC1PBL1_9PEZI|nr:hypothetical protein NUW58_g3883 [Xylaria curta]
MIQSSIAALAQGLYPLQKSRQPVVRLYASGGGGVTESGSESQDPQSLFPFLWDDNDGLDIDIADSTHLAGFQDAVNWSYSNFSLPAETISQSIQDGHLTPAELPDDERICYGMIYQVDVKLFEANMPTLKSKLQDEAQATAAKRILNFTVERKVDHLSIVFSDGVVLGMLSSSMFESLGPIMERERAFFLECVTPTHVLLERIGKITKASDRKIRMDINVYGLRETASKIGEELSPKKLWFQRPDNYQTKYPYENPHVISFPGIDHVSAGASDLRGGLDEAAQMAKHDRMQKLVSEVHVALHRANELETTTGDRRLQTPLLDHQQRALTFMRQRESGEIPDKYRLWKKSWYIHQVTKTRSTIQPEEKGGGILADEMGMGKSLCLLALLLDTLDDGREWARQKHNEEYHNGIIEGYSRSTLVVVPSALLINNWLNEVQTCGHFFCTSCRQDLEDMLKPEDSMPCPRCDYMDAAKCLQTDTIPVRNNNHKQHRRDTFDRSLYFKDVGFSTKMNALVEDVRKRMEEMKSEHDVAGGVYLGYVANTITLLVPIVFSCWTYTMDLACRHFEKAGINFLRIDGDTLMSRRQRILDEFDQESGARVLLSEYLTTGTGAFGLNITAARRVFILEPQWNPSVENQAIARTTRLNQKETVLVIRYRIEDTVETEMLSQQKQKRAIARLGW